MFHPTLHNIDDFDSFLVVSGPGKGMYSRLYKNVLANYYEIETALASNMCYTDSGIFTLQAASTPQFVCQSLLLSSFEFLFV
jgi:processing peptidase subunit alpha